MEHRFVGCDERQEQPALVEDRTLLVQRPIEVRFEKEYVLNVVLQPDRQTAFMCRRGENRL